MIESEHIDCPYKVECVDTNIIIIGKTAMKRHFIAIFIGLLVIFSCITGCGKSDLDTSEVTDYLEQRYGGEFMQISSERISRSQRQYLDAKVMETLETRSLNSDAEDEDIVERYEDETGISFHVYHYLRYGMFGSELVLIAFLRANAYEKYRSYFLRREQSIQNLWQVFDNRQTGKKYVRFFGVLEVLQKILA